MSPLHPMGITLFPQLHLLVCPSNSLTFKPHDKRSLNTDWILALFKSHLFQNDSQCIWWSCMELCGSTTSSAYNPHNGQERMGESLPHPSPPHTWLYKRGHLCVACVRGGQQSRRCRSMWWVWRNLWEGTSRDYIFSKFSKFLIRVKTHAMIQSPR